MCYMTDKKTDDTNEVLYSSDNQITTQDVPDEITLAISLSGCPLHCKGCHSSFTWKPDFGEILTDEKLEHLIVKNKYISCVLFYGGEWKLQRLLEMIAIVKKYGLKVCLYTGLTMEEVREQKAELFDVLDYIKVGRWVEALGGLNKKTTNQRLYRIERDGDNMELVDITNKFYQE